MLPFPSSFPYFYDEGVLRSSNLLQDSSPTVVIESFISTSTLQAASCSFNTPPTCSKPTFLSLPSLLQFSLSCISPRISHVRVFIKVGGPTLFRLACCQSLIFHSVSSEPGRLSLTLEMCLLRGERINKPKRNQGRRVDLFL